MSNTKTVELKHPIPVPKEGGGIVEVNKLELGRLKAKHLRLLPEDFMKNDGILSPKDILPLLAGLSNLPESSIDEIDMEDLSEVAEALQVFLETSLETGKK